MMIYILQKVESELTSLPLLLVHLERCTNLCIHSTYELKTNHVFLTFLVNPWAWNVESRSMKCRKGRSEASMLSPT